MSELGAGSAGAGNPGGAGGQQNAGGSGSEGDKGAASGNQGAGQGGGGNSGGGGAGNTSWRDTLPDDLKSNPALASFSGVDTLAKSYLHAQSMIGKKGLIPPTDKSTDEEWNSFYDQMGRPPLDKFELTPPKDRQVDKAFIDRFKAQAHKAGMLPKNAQATLDWLLADAHEMSQAAVGNMRTDTQSRLAALKKEWGQTYDTEIKYATAAADMVGPDFRKKLDETGLGDQDWIIKGLNSLGKQIVKLKGEDTIKGDGAGKFGVTHSEMDAEMAQIRTNPVWYSHQASPQKEQLNKRLSELMEKRFSA